MQALDTKSEIKRRLLYELRCSPLKKRQESLSHKGVKLALVDKKDTTSEVIEKKHTRGPRLLRGRGA